MTAPTSTTAAATVTATFEKETKAFAKFTFDEPFTGSIYVPLEIWNAAGRSQSLTVSVAATR